MIDGINDEVDGIAGAFNIDAEQHFVTDYIDRCIPTPVQRIQLLKEVADKDIFQILDVADRHSSPPSHLPQLQRTWRENCVLLFSANAIGNLRQQSANTGMDIDVKVRSYVATLDDDELKHLVRADNLSEQFQSGFSIWLQRQRMNALLFKAINDLALASPA